MFKNVCIWPAGIKCLTFLTRFSKALMIGIQSMALWVNATAFINADKKREIDFLLGWPLAIYDRQQYWICWKKGYIDNFPWLGKFLTFWTILDEGYNSFSCWLNSQHRTIWSHIDLIRYQATGQNKCYAWECPHQ